MNDMLLSNPLFKLFKYTWHYSFGMRRGLVLFIVFSIIGNTIWLLQPIIIGRIFNSIQFAKQDQISYIAKGVGLLIVVNVLGWIFHGISRTMENKNAFLVRKNYRHTLFKQVMELPTAWHKDHHSGDTIDKINKASDNIFGFSSGLFVIIQNVINLIASIIILSMYDMLALVIAFSAAVIAVLVIVKFDKKLLKNYHIINKAENFISSGVYDFISNYLTIISLRLKEQTTKEMDDRAMKPFVIFIKNTRVEEAKWFLSSFIIAAMTSGVLLLNAYTTYKAKGVIVIGTLFILYQYLDRVGGAFYTFAWKYSDTVRQNAALEAAEAIDREYKKLHLEQRFDLPDGWSNLKIRNLTFTYKNEDTGKQKLAIKNVNLGFEPGMKIALIGLSGSGKSSVLSLLRGLHEPDSATVWCDGKKLFYGMKHLYDYCTLIPQEPEIFSNTMEYNITLGVHMNPGKIQEAIRLARLDNLISRLEQGLNTSVLEKGVSLSGGEKQRLALARGLLAAEYSQFLLLDEPTSSVDVANEYKIYQNIFERFKDKVIVASIHSLHLLRNFDYIYMFKAGKIVAEGTFEKLLEDKNFQTLWQSYNLEQTKGEL